MQDFSRFNPMDFSLWGNDPRAMSGMLGGPGQDAPSSDGMLAGPDGAVLPAASGAEPPRGRINIGGIDMPAPQAATLPAPQAPSSPTEQRQNRRGRLHDAIQNILTGDTPAGYEGLLTPEEIKAAKPSLMDSLFSSTTSPTHRERLDAMVERKMLASKVQQASAVQQRQQQVLAGRAQIFQEFPPPKDGSMTQWAAKVLPRLMALGDFEAVKELSPFVSKAEGSKDQQAQMGDNVTTFTPGKGFWNPKTGKWEPSVPKSEPDSVVAHKQALEDLAQARIDTAYARLQAAGEQFSKKQLTQGVKDFTAQVKPLRDRAAVIEQALLTIDDAAHNPDPNVRRTLYTSTVANFIQAADQKAQVRYQLLNYFKNNVDPSVAGKWEVLKARMLKGALPGYTMEGMLTHLKNLRELTRSEIEAQRDGLVKRRPELDEALPTLDEFFPTMSNDAPATATPPATAPAAGGFDLNAWLKANPPAGKKP